MDTFITSIKEKYRERLINREEQWPPCHSDKLVRLELVERKKGEGYSANVQRGKSREDKDVKRTPLAYGDLFKVESGKRPVRKILVEGDAGIGKTTLCISVSEDWANGKLFQQFELVLHLPLRMKVVASAGSLPELLKLLHPSPRLCESVARYLEEEEGKGVLIIADGWDELGESEQQKSSFLYQLLFETFPFISVVVTSRPFASASFHRLSCIDRFAEIQGFSKENIREYIESEFPSDQRKVISLLEQLEHNPLIESVCSVPLNCAIICHLWRTLEEALPTTMTMLYTNIFLNIILRNIQKKDAFKHIDSLPNFIALPKELQQSWALLCKFAFEAIVKDQIVFSQEKLADIFPHGVADILCFGLLQTAKTILETGYGMSFHFLHLTFQEYLAAFHLATLPSIERLELFQYHHNLPFMVFRFFFGIYFNVVGCTDCAPIQPYVSYIRDELVCCHCAFEARNKVIVNSIIRLLIDKGESKYYSGWFGSPRTAHDCSVVLYVIDNMEECSQGMHIRFSGCHITENQIKALTSSLANKHGKLRVKRLDLSGNKLTYECVGELLDRAANAFQSLEELNLGNTEIKPKHITTILGKPSCQGLSNLNLPSKNLGVSGLQALENVVSSGWLANLKDLNLSGCLTDDADINATALETFLKSLSAHCPKLDMLNLSDNNLGVPGASTLAVAISQNSTRISYHYERESLWLKTIFLNNAKLGNEGLSAFTEKLVSPCFFDNLYLQNNHISATGLTYLAAWLDENYISECYDLDHLMDYNLSNCEELDLGDNPLGCEGIITVGEILESCDQLVVNLSRCHLTTVVNHENTGNPTNYDAFLFRDVGQQLCQMPKSFISLLDLTGNSFTGERIHILAGFIHLCENLYSLFCSDCNITSDDLIQLLEILAESKASYPDLCSRLVFWSLDNNKIDDRGVSELMNYATSLFPNLGKDADDDGVDLGGNPVSKEMVDMLEKQLHPHMCQQLNDVIDVGNGGVSKHLGQIADTMYEWEGPVAEQLGLIPADVAAIKVKHPGELKLQARAALETWKQKLGSSATYNNLIGVFERAGYSGYADTVRKLLAESAADLRSPASKRPCKSTSLHQLVDLVRWKEADGAEREPEIQSNRAHEWTQSATQLGAELGDVKSIEQRQYHHRDEPSVTATCTSGKQRIDNVPDPSKYPKSWQGFSNLLEDAKLSEIAKELSSVHKTERAALEKWKQKLGDQNYADTVHDKLSPSQQSVYGGRGDPQALPRECAAAGATYDIDLCRKRKSATTQDGGNWQISLPQSQPLQVLWPRHPQCAVQSKDQHVEQDFRPPPQKRKFTDDMQDVKHRFLDLIKWEDENGVKRELRIYSKIAHKWRQIATRLGFELGEIESIEENHHRNSARITAVLRQWFENAKNLPNGSRYPKSWQGLINLLEDTELGEVAGELKRALSSPWNSVRDYLS